MFRPAKPTSLRCVHMSDALARPICVTAVFSMFTCSVTSYRQHATRLEVAGDLTRYRERKLTNSLSLVGWIQV